MECTFVVGDKVTLRRQGPWMAVRRGGSSYSTSNAPVFGSIYTVREVYLSTVSVVCLRLVEIVGDNDAGYDAKSFRRAHDLSVFDEIREGKRKPVLEDA
jgi:hypothetical protein